MHGPVGEVLPRRLPWEHGPASDRWVQVGLAPASRTRGVLLTELAALVRGWRGSGVIEDFFFMHRPPGLRVVFAPAPGHAPIVRTELRGLVRGWCANGLVDRIEPGRYEPADHLFGGQAAMDQTHRMFTVDAVTWLDFHATPRAAPSWALSFAMLRAVFDAMGLDALGFGDRRERDVWAHVATAGRLLPAGPCTSAAEDAVRQRWRTPARLLTELPADVHALAAAHAEAVAPLATAWANALPGTETNQAVAWYVVFHWNRAALTTGRQALLTAALATVERSCGDVR